MGACLQEYDVLCGPDYTRGAGHLIVISDILIFCMLALLGFWAYNSGDGTVRVYFVPWLVCLCHVRPLTQLTDGP